MNSLELAAQEAVVLYQGDRIPNALPHNGGYLGEDHPQIFFYAAQGQQQARRQAILIIPGGGYARVALQHEGHDVAQVMAAQGYDAYVLKYRLPKDSTMVDKRYGPLQDAQQALAQIRSFQDYAKVGVLGFSAGGHLAASLSTMYSLPQVDHRLSLRPDFAVLLYPVISMDAKITHRGSRDNLLGRNPAQADVEQFSMELQVNHHTPPTFMMHAEDDQAVPIAHATRYQQALAAASVAHELFTYKTGGHGFGLHNKTDSRSWMEALLAWLPTLPR